MSKTTFKTDTPTPVPPPSRGRVREGGTTPEDSVPAGKSSYKAMGASKWKGISSPLEDGLGDTISAFGDALKPVVDAGALSGLDIAPKPVSQFGLTIEKGPAKDAYTSKYQAVELPPSAVESAALFPADKDELKGTIEETRSFYYDYMELYIERKANAERTLAGGQLSEQDADIVRQFIGKLDSAIDFVKEQLEALKTMEANI